MKGAEDRLPLTAYRSIGIMDVISEREPAEEAAEDAAEEAGEAAAVSREKKSVGPDHESPHNSIYVINAPCKIIQIKK